jgi:ferredoxin
MRIRVERAKCVGHGRCYVLAPDVFEDDERGHCVVTKEELAPELEEQAQRGQQNCPEHAISLLPD